MAHRPDLSDRQRAIVEYLVLRGVTVRRDGAEPRLELFSTDAPWLREVAGALGWLANDPRRHDARDEDADVWSFTTVPHPELDYGGPTDVERLRPLTARLLVGERGELVGALFGSLHVDVRGWDVEGGHVRRLLHDWGVTTVEYEGEGYAADTFTERYHWHPEVVVVPHYDACDLLNTVGVDVSDVAAPID